MRKLFALLAALVMAASLGLNAFAADEDLVKIDFSKTYQTIDGFGASYTWYGDWLATNVNAEEGFDWIFNDAEFNILRFRDLNHVGEEYQNALNGYPAYYAYYKAAVDRGVKPIVMVTSWGQYDRDLPWVAYTEKSDNGYSYFTLAKDENGEYMYDELADFCVESIKLFFDAGIPVDYFSISNEIELQERHVDEQGNQRSDAGFFFGQEENEYHCAYWKAHIAVYEAFKEAFGEYAPKLLGAETMAGYPDLLKGYLDPVIENCPESLEVVAHHLYGMDLGEGNMTAVKNAMDGYRIWETEWYNSDFFGHAEVVMDELIYENVSAYLYWNGVWIADLGNCLIEIGGADANASIQRIGNHYIMMHYSKFIKNGYQRVDVEESLGSKVAAFKSPDGSKLAVVVMNPTEKDEYMTLDLGGKTILDSACWLSTEGENRFANDYMMDNGKYEDELFIPARSLMTIDIDLEADPNYVAPVVEEKVNPFVKDPSAKSAGLSAPVIIALACAGAAVVAAIILTVVITSKHTKKIAKAEENENKGE